MTVAVAVQYRPERKHLLPRLLPELEKADSLTLVEDPEPDSPMRSAWRTYHRCLETLNAQTLSHGLIVQDDALPCPDFIPALRNAVEAQPEAIIVLCVCGSSPVNCLRIGYAAEAGHSFVELDTWTWVQTVAVVYPLAALDAFVEWVRAKPLPVHQRTDDPVVASFVQAHDFRLLATVPNLVDHPDDSPSLFPDTPFWDGAAPERRSCCFIGPDCSALDIDWTLGP